MIAAPMMTQGIKVELPKAAADPVDTKDDEPITVSIKQDGSYYIEAGGDPEKARPLDEVKSIVKKILAEKPDTLVFVQADRRVQYGAVVELMAELKVSGAPSVGLITEPPRK